MKTAHRRNFQMPIKPTSCVTQNPAPKTERQEPVCRHTSAKACGITNRAATNPNAQQISMSPPRPGGLWCSSGDSDIRSLMAFKEVDFSARWVAIVVQNVADQVRHARVVFHPSQPVNQGLGSVLANPVHRRNRTPSLKAVRLPPGSLPFRGCSYPPGRAGGRFRAVRPQK